MGLCAKVEEGVEVSLARLWVIKRIKKISIDFMDYPIILEIDCYFKHKSFSLVYHLFNIFIHLFLHILHI